MSNLENEIDSDQLSESNTTGSIKPDLSHNSSDVDTFSTIIVDQNFRRKINFLGLMQQILAVLGIIVAPLSAIRILGIIIVFGVLPTILVVIVFILYIIFAIKYFKAGTAFKKSLITLNGNDLKEGLLILSDQMKICLIMIIVTIMYYISIILFLIVSYGQL